MDCQTEAKGFFEELISWKEESYAQISNIIDSHNNNVTSGIKDLEDEICGLQTELLSLREERAVLLKTVDYLHSEIRELKTKQQPLPELGEDLSYETRLAVSYGGEKSETIRQGNQEPQICNEYEDDADDEAVPAGGSIQIQELNISAPTNDDSFSKSTLHDSSDKDEGNDEHFSVYGQETEAYVEKIEKKQYESRRSLYIKNKIGKLKCKKCQYETPVRQNLYRHVKAVHDKIKDHVCEICGFAASQKGHVREHMKNIHKINRLGYWEV